MQMRKRYVIDGFQLEINPAAYLVEVSTAKNAVNEQNVTELPDWVFQSKHAIWLTSGSAKMIDRALEGERVQKKLKQKFSRKNIKETSTDLLPGALELIALHSA
jgi:hypothetical protein